MTFGKWLDSLLRQGFPRSAGKKAPSPSPAPPVFRHPTEEEWASGQAERMIAIDLYRGLELVGDPERAAEGTTRIVDAIWTTEPAQLARIDEAFRAALWALGLHSGPRWLNPAADADRYGGIRDASAMDGLRLPPGGGSMVLGVLAMHPSGFVREAAVRRLAALDRGAELPFLLLRANDWTFSVRELAARAVMDRARPEAAPHFVRWLPLLIRLEESGRAGLDAVVGAVKAVLRAPEARPALMEALWAPDRRVRRVAFPLLVEGVEGPPLLEAILAGMTKADTVVRRMAVREVRRLPLKDARELFDALLYGGSGAERLEGLRVVDGFGAVGEPWLRGAARDRSGVVRATARAMLKARGVTDFAGFYREVLESGGRGADGALLGLGETGGADDVAVVERFLADPRVHVRGAAVEALARLLRDRAVPLVLPLLADDDPHVSRAVRVALERLPVPRPALEALFAGPNPPHVRVNALALLARGSTWEAIRRIVRACADADPRVAEAGQRELARWRVRAGRSFQQPTADQLAALAPELDAAAGRIDAETLRRLRAGVRHAD